jgi:integrase
MLAGMASSAERIPVPQLHVREQGGRYFYEAKFWFQGGQVKRRVGPAWLEADGSGGYKPRRGRPGQGFYEERTATTRAAKLVESYIEDEADRERFERERKARGVTFREVAADYLRWMQDVKGAKPSTLASHRYDLAEPGPRRRGKGEAKAHVMRALGDMPAAKITRQDIESLLAAVSDTGVSPRSVNRIRSVVSAVFNYGIRHRGLPANPVTLADKRREPRPGALVFYSAEEIEAIANALSTGQHRDLKERDRTVEEEFEDRQDAEAVRVAAYCGLRLGELLALRWRDIDWTGNALTISRALSVGIEGETKSGHIRRIPMPDQAAVALERVSRRHDFTEPNEFVFCNAFGRVIDGSALRRRYKRARDRAGMRPLRWHDLRHTFGSILAANGIDLITIKSVMGHADLKTTERYLHARSEAEMAGRFTRAFSPRPAVAVGDRESVGQAVDEPAPVA